MQRVVLREIRKGGAPADRDGKELGKLDQCGKGCGIAAGGLGQDDRVAGPDQQLGDFLDIGVLGPRPGRRRDPALVLVRSPFLQHHFKRRIEVDGPHRSALRELAGAYDVLVEGVHIRRLGRPFGHRLDQALRTADDAEAAVPLRLDRELRILAKAHRLARQDDHRHFGEHRRMHAGRALQEAGAGVQQHRLHAARHLRVAHRHVDGQGLVPAIDIGRARLLVDLLAGECLPHRRPFRARRGDDVIEAQAAKRLEDRLAAIAILLHPDPP
jgi:hypothetical protein